MLPRRCPSSTHSRNPSSDLFHVGRADAPKKMSNCRVIERLPRIARIPHLKTQTTRTPRTPRVKNSTTMAKNKRVGRQWSPPGGLQSAAHRRWCTACRTNIIKPQHQTPDTNIEWPCCKCLMRFSCFPILKSFPRHVPYTGNPSPKSGKVCFCCIVGRFFRLPKRASKTTSKKHGKKCEN